MSKLQEIWKDIPNYEGLYEASASGLIRNKKRNKILAPCVSRVGYLNVNLYRNGAVKGFPVSRLVAITFIPNPLNKPHVNHISGIKANNNVQNLEWVTVSENRIHAVNVLGCQSAYGEKNASAKLNNAQVLEILKTQGTLKSIADKFGITITAVWYIKNGKTWKHLTQA